MVNKENLLEVKNLEVAFSTYRGKIKAVRGVNLELKAGEVLGIVGESGCGKSVTAHALMGLLPKSNSTIENGSIMFDNTNLLEYGDKEWQKVRGNDIAMIFQDPMTSLNPVITIGKQLKEAYKIHNDCSESEATARVVELLRLVGIPSPEKRLTEYPHQFSGGMRQRVMIAMALTCSPKLLIADEPTTALDVTVQAQILELLQDLRERLNMSIILISHDLGVVANLSDRVAVMYAGEVVEQGTTDDIFYNPHHPYTVSLLKSLPRLTDVKNQPLYVIDGQPIDLKLDIPYCPFAKRCDEAMNICSKHKPNISNLDEHHYVRCWLEAKAEHMRRKA